MAGRKRRDLTPEERALWREVASDAIPLHPETRRPPSAPGKIALPPVPPLLLPPAKPPEPGRVTLDLVPSLADRLARPDPAMDRRRFEKLRRGRLTPEARLDLHGMTAERAHSALTRFILSAHAEGLRLVLIITGKGRTDAAAIAPQRHGVLRHSLPHWLRTPPLAAKVLEIAAAHRRHGGDGAFYVYLRRQR